MTIKHVETTVAEAMRQMGIAPTSHIGVALSGGADSVALLTALARCSMRVTALHCDFSLRGAESDADSSYCDELCAKLGITLSKVKFDTHASRRQGESIEMVCRRLRYEWFEAEARTRRLDYIALGHHIEDSIETMMLNLTRGSGPKGLSGIAPRRGIYVRPMLMLTRADIEAYLDALGIGYRTDSSNLANDYRRNAFRNVLLPKLYEIVPTAQAGMMRTADAMRHSAAMIATYLRWCALRYCSDGRIDIDAMRRDGIDLSGTLYMLLPEAIGANPAMDIVEQILAEPDNRASRLFPDGNGQLLELYAGRLERYAAEDDSEYEITLTEPIDSPIALTASMVTPEEFAAAKKDADTLWLDASIIDQPHRFALRHRRDGDKMHPFGAPGTRLVSDIFTDLKMSRSQRNRTYLLTVDDRPIWIVGVRASNSFIVTENSKKIIKLQVAK